MNESNKIYSRVYKPGAKTSLSRAHPDRVTILIYNDKVDREYHIRKHRMVDGAPRIEPARHRDKDVRKHVESGTVKQWKKYDQETGLNPVKKKQNQEVEK